MKRLTEAWFEFDGVRSDAMGIYIKQMPVRGMPGRNVNKKKVAGRDGTVTYGPATYTDITVRIECDVRDETKMDAIAAWLTGRGNLRFSDEPHLMYDASIDREISRSSITPRLTGQRFTVTWTCAPYKRLYPDADSLVIDSNTDSIYNPGTAFAQPKINIVANGNFSLTIGDQTMFFTDVDKNIELDCAAMEALDQYDHSANKQVSGEYFKIQPGINSVSFDVETGSSFTLAVIDPRWRYL